MSNYRIVYPDDLYHYGVKGMRWGHRKQRPITSMRGRWHRYSAATNNVYARMQDRMGNKTAANAHRRAADYSLKKAEAADLQKQQKINSPEYQARKQRAKKIAVVGGSIVTAGLAIYGAKKLYGTKASNIITTRSNKEVFKPKTFKPETFKPETFKPETFKPETFKPETFKVKDIPKTPRIKPSVKTSTTPIRDVSSELRRYYGDLNPKKDDYYDYMNSVLKGLKKGK